jgi:hypothetical protein
MNAASKTHKHDANDIYSGTLDKARLPVIPENKLPTIPTEKGGTGATTAEKARKNLGTVHCANRVEGYDTRMGSDETHSWVDYFEGATRQNSMSLWKGGTEFVKPVLVKSGGTGATDEAGARTNLGVPATSDLESGKIIVNKSTYSTYAEQATKATNATNATNAKILDPDNVVDKDVEYVTITTNGLYMVEFKVTTNIYASSIIYIRANKDCLGSTTHDAVKDMPMYASFSMATKKLTVINPIGNTYTIIKVQRLVSN